MACPLPRIRSRMSNAAGRAGTDIPASRKPLSEGVSMRTPWFRCDARISEDPRVAKLKSDVSRWAFVRTLGLAKQQRPQGMFESSEHLAAALGHHSKYIPDLIAVGLLQLNDDGTLLVRRWHDWQTEVGGSAERTRRWRERIKVVGGRDVTP